jgi:hypothetical protein
MRYFFCKESISSTCEDIRAAFLITLQLHLLPLSEACGEYFALQAAPLYLQLSHVQEVQVSTCCVVICMLRCTILADAMMVPYCFCIQPES